MGAAVGISRDDLSASDLRALAARTRDGDVVRRLLALALLLEGSSRSAAAQATGMDYGAVAVEGRGGETKLALPIFLRV